MHTLKKKTWRITIQIVCLVIAFSLSFPGYVVNAQEITGDWTDPVNISVSGGAVNPSAVVDSRGVLHLIWEDIFSGFLYSQMSDDSWTIPEKVFFPFLPISTSIPGNITNTSPVFVSNGKGTIHAFWLDSRGVLFHSYVIETVFNQSTSWLPRQVLSESVTNFNVISDKQGNIHLTYVKSSSSSFEKSGILYRKQVNGIWQTPKQIFESNYFRLLSAAEANVQVESVENEIAQRIYIFWDNQPSNSVMGSFSDDIGLTWSDEYVVDGPSPQRETERLIQIKSGSINNHIILVWKSDQLGQSCTQYYQYSDDGGLTWQEKQPIINSISGCVGDYDILAGENGLFVMSSTLQDLKYLSVWNGKEWSEPRQQAILSNYIDPSNYNLIRFTASELFMMPGNKLASVATSSNDVFPGDVWWITRDLGQINDWQSVGTNWSTFDRVNAPLAPQLSSGMVEDGKGRIHLISVADPSNAREIMDKEIFYSRWEDGIWSVHAGVLSSPEGNAGSVSIASTKNNQLVAVWNDTRGRSLFLSKASADRALNPSEWSMPVKILHSSSTSSDPQIITISSNQYYLIFAAPINERRGIYFLKSNDGGENWEPEKLIASGETIGWLKVGNPRIATGDGKNIFAIWLVYPFLENPNYSMLYFSSSSDAGETWASPQKIDEGLIMDHTIASDGIGNIHRYWRKVEGITTELNHSFSGNNGARWLVSPVISLVKAPISDSTRFVVGKGGVVSLVQVSENSSNGDWGINTWNWLDGKWLVGDSNNIRIAGTQEIFGLNVEINSTSQIEVVVLFSGPKDIGSEQAEYSYYSTYRDIENIVDVLVTVDTEIPVQSTPTIEFIQPTLVFATQTPVDLSGFVDNPGTNSEGGPGMFIGIGAGLLVVGLFLFFQFRPKNRK